MHGIVAEGVFWLTNEKEEVIYVSPAYEKIWGRPCESCYGGQTHFLDAVHPEDADEVKFILQHRASGFDVNYRIIRPDGTVRWIAHSPCEMPAECCSTWPASRKMSQAG
jgi:PAS domain S-box-containing protein